MREFARWLVTGYRWCILLPATAVGFTILGFALGRW